MGSTSDIDDQISHHRYILLSLPRSDPSHVSHIHALARLYNNRYVRSDQKEDLDRAIFHFTQPIFASRVSWDIDGENIVQTFFLLASVVLQRSDHFNQPSDAQYCAGYFRYLQSQPLEAFDVPSNQVRASLVVALASQVKAGIGDAVKHIDEMTDHCRELLASDVPQSHLSRAARALASASFTDHEQSSELEVSDKLIKCLRDANKRIDSRELAYSLAGHLFTRFVATHAIEDYEEAMAIFDKIISSESNGNHPGPYWKTLPISLHHLHGTEPAYTRIQSRSKRRSTAVVRSSEYPPLMTSDAARSQSCWHQL